MKIDILTTDGSPLGVTCKTIYGDGSQVGCGGAELALLTMCEVWAKRGYEVTLYNSPREVGVSPFEQRNVAQFDAKDDRDVLIVFRSPNARTLSAKGLKVWWSTDQYTIGNFQAFAPTVNKIVTISPFHDKHFKENYGVKDTTVIDLPIRLWDYDLADRPERVPYRMLFSSVPDRGLEVLWRMWPLVKREIPQASLTITSDYRLWGSSDPNNISHRIKWSARNDFTFMGAVPRKELIQQQLMSDILLYPCTYDELFCLTVGEAQVAGAYPVTTDKGALETTNMGTIFRWNALDPRGDRNFVAGMVDLFKDREILEWRRKSVQEAARKRFDPERIADVWDREIFKCG